MKPKIFGILSLCVLIISACQKADDDTAVVSQRFIHKYGFELSSNEWEARNKNGQVITILKNGITQKNEYKSGILHGTTTLTFPFTQTIQEKSEFNEGLLTKQTTYELGGLPIQENIFELDGKKIITIWDKNGVPLSMEEYSSNQLLLSARYFNSQNEIEETITGGKGLRIKRDREGLLLAREKIENGKITKRTTYHPNGEVQSECAFIDYKLHGEQKTFSPSGHLLTHAQWENGQLNGKLICYHNEKPYLETPYQLGKKHGIAKEYNAKGNLIKEIHWDQDKKHGSSRYYYDGYTDVEWYWKGVAVDLKKFQTLEFREELMAEINGEKQPSLDHEKIRTY